MDNKIFKKLQLFRKIFKNKYSHQMNLEKDKYQIKINLNKNNKKNHQVY